jgi:hypothetical protein
MRVPGDAPPRCPVCGADYDSVSAHDDGLLVNLLDNERYRRVCFDPVAGDSAPLVYFYHHTHEQVSDGENAPAVDPVVGGGQA